jgi:hypothetical protein
MPMWLAVPLLAAPALSACGSSASHHQRTAELKRKGLERRRSQVTWVANITGSTASQIAKLAIDRKGTSDGKWHLVFQARNVNLTNPQGAPAAAGLILGSRRSSGRMRFGADPKCPDQSKATTGLYDYRISGSRLTVTELNHSDSCSLRVKALTGASWTKA